jgi:hypothetical protein
MGEWRRLHRGRSRWRLGREGQPTAGKGRGAASGLERGGKKKLALYHVGNPNPNKGLGDVLIDRVSWACPITQGEKVNKRGKPQTLTIISKWKTTLQFNMLFT